MQAYLDAIRRDSAFYLFIVAYGFLTYATSQMLGVSAKFQPHSIVYIYLKLASLVLVPLLIWLGISSLRAASPVAAFLAKLRTLVSPQRIAGALVVVGIAVFMSIFASAKSLLPDVVPFWADPLLADIDEALSGGQAPWQYLPRSPALTRIVDGLYGVPWFGLLFFSICAAALSNSAYRLQYLFTFVLCWTLLGNVVAATFMSGGPVYFEALTGNTEFRALTDDVAANGPWSLMVRDELWRNYVDSSIGRAVGISAFPSMHLSISTLFVLQANRIHPRLAVVAAAYCLWILTSSVYLGWHYAVDGYFSIVATIAIWKVVGWLLQAKPGPRGFVPAWVLPSGLRPASAAAGS